MKLSEVDQIIELKKLHDRLKLNIKSLSDRSNVLNIECGGRSFVNDSFDRADPYKKALLRSETQRLEETITKLAMIGVTDFEN